MKLTNLLFFFLILLFSCNQTDKKKETDQKKEKTSGKEMVFHAIKHANIGVILTDELIVYDRFGSFLSNPSNLINRSLLNFSI